MEYKLNWDKLFCEERVRKSGAELEYRNAFEADYHRIIGSSSVRRLQDKAQVFPLQENDFTRTRLTHSIEVSSLARSLGKAVGKRLEKDFDKDTGVAKFDAIKTDKLQALLQTLGLIHDLGNPPFGHYGETVIREWFRDWFDKNESSLTERQKNDFLFFDGNVQNLRIVSKLQMLNDVNGINFTYATLAGLMKYPWKSSEYEKYGKEKFGYFESEDALVKKIREITGLETGIRHPVTYLLEAADDITYIADDIEDGVKKGLINWKVEYERLKRDFNQPLLKKIFSFIDKRISDRSVNMPDKEEAQVLDFRNLIQGLLFDTAVDNFISNYESIMNGTYGIKELISNPELDSFVQRLRDITAENCFNCREVLSLELVGDRVIKNLLDIFIPSIINATSKDIEKVKKYQGKLYHIISSNFKYIAQYDYINKKECDFSALSVYNKIQLVVDYVSGMTDSYAVNLYKELAGIKLP